MNEIQKNIDSHVVKILEIGGGTGAQAKALSKLGYEVISVDVEASNYKEQQVFPIELFDGHSLPFDNQTFDMVFSSNVLEHIKHLHEFNAEMMRVLKPNGYCVHVMPTGTWTFWTMLAHYIDIPIKTFKNYNNVQKNRQLCPASDLRERYTSIASKYFSILQFLLKSPVLLLKENRNHLFPKRHGEKYFLLAELFTFSTFAWRSFFKSQNCSVSVSPMQLFYTGYMIFGSSLSFRKRYWLSWVLGSSVMIYIVRNRNPT